MKKKKKEHKEKVKCINEDRICPRSDRLLFGDLDEFLLKKEHFPRWKQTQGGNSILTLR